MDILLENFRCFSGAGHRVPIRPLTLLVGENSTGKSAFIASIGALANPDRFPLSPGFNAAPFELGTYETIATHKGTSKSADYFRIGFEEGDQKSGRYTYLMATYVERAGRAQFSHLELKTDIGSMDARWGSANTLEVDLVLSLTPHGPKKRMRIHARGMIRDAPPIDLRVLLISQIFSQTLDQSHHWATAKKHPPRRNSERLLEVLSQLIGRMAPTFGQALAIAPIRSKPQRTYDTLSDDFDPEGRYIPLRLAKLFEGPNRTQARALHRVLRLFGEQSGLFEDVTVKKFRARTGSAFQVYVKMGRRNVNLIDVGYGVSQSLPVIVQSVLTQDRIILLQQPEVHLHPRAQAALGTLFLGLASRKRKTLVIETHSDYLIDRVRHDVALNKLDPKMVSLLYFERTGTNCLVHAIELDEDGNIRNAPPGYRRFFLDEEMSLLQRKRDR